MSKAEKLSDDKPGFLSAFFSNVKHMDGWHNIFAGLNVKNKDARATACVNWKQLSETDIENLYAGDAMATKIVDMPVEEAMEKGYKIIGIGTEQEKKLGEKLKFLKFNEIITSAAKKARLYGGASILKVYNDSLKMNEPPSDGQKEIKSLTIFHRFEIPAYWEDVQKDIFSPEFGQPVQYTFVGRSSIGASISSIKIHTKRLTRFEGAWLPDRLKQSNSYWNDTVLSKPYDAIRNYAFAHDSANACLKDLSVGEFKIKNLADQIAANNDDLILKRLALVNISKSMTRAIVLDAEGESFEYKNRNLSGAGDLVACAESRLAAESGFSRTVLYGDSPSGLGQSGNHESENWYSWLAAYQTNYLKPNMLEIIKEVCEELNISTEKLDIEFAPLWEMDAKDLAEMKSKQADTDIKYVSDGILSPEEVRQSRFGGEKYSTETVIDQSVEAESEVKPTEEDAKAVEEGREAPEENKTPKEE